VPTEQTDAHRTSSIEFYLNAVASERANGARTRDGEGCANALRTMPNDIECSASLAGPNDGTVAAHNTRGLLFRNCLTGVAEVLLMIKANIRDDRDPAVPGVRCIEPTTEAHLHNCRGDLLLAQRFEDCADEDLELGGWSDALFDLVGGVKGSCDRLGKREWGERLTVDLHAFPVADEVRLGGGGVANPRRTESCGDESNDAPLAVRACHERAANPQLW
jgi:hypothetical protein